MKINIFVICLLSLFFLISCDNYDDIKIDPKKYEQVVLSGDAAVQYELARDYSWKIRCCCGVPMANPKSVMKIDQQGYFLLLLASANAADQEIFDKASSLRNHIAEKLPPSVVTLIRIEAQEWMEKFSESY